MHLACIKADAITQNGSLKQPKIMQYYTTTHNISIFQEKNEPEFLQWSTAQINATNRAAAYFLIYELL